MNEISTDQESQDYFEGTSFKDEYAEFSMFDWVYSDLVSECKLTVGQLYELFKEQLRKEPTIIPTKNGDDDAKIR